MEEFLKQIGTEIKEVAELSTGCIIASPNKHQEGEVRLYFVEKIYMEMGYPHLIAPGPWAKLKQPHVGFHLGNGKIGRKYLHTPRPGDSCKTSWQPWGQYHGEDKEIIDEALVFKVTDPEFIKLGKLIPLVEVPNWGFLCQTPDSFDTLHEYAESVKLAMEEGRRIYEAIKFTERRLSR